MTDRIEQLENKVYVYDAILKLGSDDDGIWISTDTKTVYLNPTQTREFMVYARQLKNYGQKELSLAIEG